MSKSWSDIDAGALRSLLPKLTALREMRRQSDALMLEMEHAIYHELMKREKVVNDNEILWTPKLFREFVAAYKVAHAAQQENFTFAAPMDGELKEREFYIGYAFYLIEYLTPSMMNTLGGYPTVPRPTYLK